MNPKTFQIVITKPLGDYHGGCISMYLHQESWDSAFAWAASTFPGVSTENTLLCRDAAPRTLPDLRTSIQLQIFDVDLYLRKTMKGGKPFAIKVPEGKWRCGPDRVEEDLKRALEFLRVNLAESRKSFTIQKELYKCGRFGEDTFDRLLELKQMIERGEIWEENLRKQLKSLGPDKELEMPEKRGE